MALQKKPSAKKLTPKGKARSPRNGKAIVIIPGANTDDGGGRLDLYSYLVNELDNRHIKARIYEVSTIPEQD